MAALTLDDLVVQLERAYGNELTSIVLYGSAATEDFVPRHSDYNVLVIVRRLGLERLRAVAAVTRAWVATGNPPPITLTEDEWRSSADIFPMEYSDILERHRVLFGEPQFGGLKVDPEHLRLEMEHQTMGLLLSLRQGLLAAANNRREQLELLEQSLGSVLAIFRAALRLHGEKPPADAEAVISRMAEHGGFEATPFERVVRHVRRTGRIATDEVPTLLSGYLAGVQRLVAYLDTIEAG